MDARKQNACQSRRSYASKRKNANNLNQYARIANECGSVYLKDIQSLQKQQKLMWIEMRKILEELSKLGQH